MFNRLVYKLQSLVILQLLLIFQVYLSAFRSMWAGVLSVLLSGLHILRLSCIRAYLCAACERRDYDYTA